MANYPANSPTKEVSDYFFKHKAFGLLVAAFLLLRLLSAAFLPDRHYLQASDLTTANISNAVNRERSLRNLVVLNYNDKLASAAQSKAEDMIVRKYFAHVDPDGHYIWDKIVADGYAPYAQLGENLAIEFYDTDSLMNAWMNSPTHRANILQEGFRDQGMGVDFGNVSEGQYYSAIANTFGTLAAAAKAAPVPQNPAPTTKTSPPSAVAAKPPAPATAAPAAGTVPSTTPLTLRGDGTPENPSEPSFALPAADYNTAASTSPSQPGQSASAVVGNDAATLNNYQANRYLILIAGVALMLLIGTDIKNTMAKRLGGLDKKINNLALLFIALIVIAFMYWL